MLRSLDTFCEENVLPFYIANEKNEFLDGMTNVSDGELYNYNRGIIESVLGTCNVEYMIRGTYLNETTKYFICSYIIELEICCMESSSYCSFTFDEHQNLVEIMYRSDKVTATIGGFDYFANSRQ